MGASMSNTGFMGTAILTMLIGSHAAIYISLTLIIENLLIVALMLILAKRVCINSNGFAFTEKNIH
jgi:predicted permease